ncbi:MAG: nucleotide exchange factor GrpE [Atopobiaceae bacterium]|nr:nucleotide exchange factor GrpE [Atopobiaceae bacterium]
MGEAAKRAGEAAAEEDLKAEADRAREEAGDLLAQLAEAESAVEAAKKEAAEATNRFTRLQADWENFRKRTAAERLAEKERAAEKLVLGLLPVLDDMERASEHATANSADDENLMQFVEGVNAVHDKMVAVLAKEGVEVINPVGEAFDPLVHQAVGRVEDTEAYDETVAQVYQRGYSMGGKVIRSAMVTVTYGGPKRPAPETEN